MTIQSVFYDIILKYRDARVAESMWKEIASRYGKRNRFYHNINHLENMLIELQPLRTQIRDWEVTIFALVYHDVIYKVLRQDNEVKSAEMAITELNRLSLDHERVLLCADMILNTRAHLKSPIKDINLFTDADMSILGKPAEEYRLYAAAVRREYSIYPDFVYNPGRVKVLNSFLAKDSLYHSDHFFTLYESRARENIKAEIEELIAH